MNLVQPFIGIGLYNAPILEVSASLDGGEFRLLGSLFRGDWGAYVACGRTLDLKFRSVVRSHPGPEVRDRKETYRIEIVGKPEVYFNLAEGLEVLVRDAFRLIAEIERSPGPARTTGFRFGEGAVNFYYAPECMNNKLGCR